MQSAKTIEDVAHLWGSFDVDFPAAEINAAY